MNNDVPMVRLSTCELAAICSCFRHNFLTSDKLWLFGSRVDQTKKGGDIDLYIETNIANSADIIDAKIKFLVQLQKIIGEQKIDVVLNMLVSNISLPIYQLAKAKGVQLV